MENLMVTAEMFSGSVFIHKPNLDGILLREFCLQNLDNFYDINTNIDNFEYPKDFENIIEVIKKDDVWFYACSDCICDIDKSTISYWNRRFEDRDTDRILNTKKKIQISRGEYRNYRMPMITNLVKSFTWYLKGDRREIKKLLNHITNVGKKAQSQGKGQIHRWEIVDIKEDYSIYKNKTLIKTVPIEYTNNKIDITNDYIINTVSYRPPYWLRPPHSKSSFTQCIVPILNGEVV